MTAFFHNSSSAKCCRRLPSFWEHSVFYEFKDENALRHSYDVTINILLISQHCRAGKVHYIWPTSVRWGWLWSATHIKTYCERKRTSRDRSCFFRLAFGRLLWQFVFYYQQQERPWQTQVSSTFMLLLEILVFH